MKLSTHYPTKIIMKTEYNKLIEDPIYFTENYVVIDGEPIILHDYQIKLMKWLLKHKSKKNKK